MSTEQPTWLWDASRQAYYVWSAVEQCYIFQDGTKIAAAAPSNAQQNPLYSTTPRNEGATQEAADALSRQRELVQHSHRRDSNSTGSNTGYGLEHQFSSLNIAPGYAPTTQAAQTTDPSDRRATLQRAPEAEVTDTELYNQGFIAQGKIKGTDGSAETLDKEYKKQSLGFWKVGKVIKILWPELAGNTTEKQTVLSDERFRNEKIITKIRWFVIVKVGLESCTCVPISTYGGRGCAKNVAKWQHCIVYTGKNEPDLLPDEQPRNNERPMLTAIPVRPREGDKRLYMAAASRINFGKMYTVEYNVKVFDFGDVRRSYVPYLVNQWKWVLDCDRKGNNTAYTTAATATVPEDTETANEAEVTVVGYGTALWAWSSPEKGQLHMLVNDRITVTYLDENWGQGQNSRTLERGSFPRNYVKIDGSDS